MFKTEQISRTDRRIRDDRRECMALGRLPDEPEVTVARAVGPYSQLEGVRVLLVEDHDLVREVISRLLAAYGAAVTATAGVAEALDALVRERPDVVLSDIELADEDGYDLIRKVRDLPQDRGGQTPAAGLTGLSTEDNEARVLRAGYQYYLAKPVDARVLVRVVASLAARPVLGVS
jgi:CheY-like chemotaxis protein